MKPAAVIFDCDGVVVDSEPLAFDLLAVDLASHGLTMTSHQLETELLGGTMHDAFKKARGLGADLPDTWVEGFYEKLYAKLALGTPLIPGIEAVLDALDAAAVPYAMGSNGSPRKMEITMGQHKGLLARFHGRTFSGQAMGRPKPAPDLYLHCAAIMGVDPETCTVIEDSPTGARAAAAAGMRCFGYAPHGSRLLAAAGAILFTSMTELPGLLDL
ncbi:MAG: HAD-IA family hydrolase [Paracoccaceae bacterium]